MINETTCKGTNKSFEVANTESHQGDRQGDHLKGVRFNNHTKSSDLLKNNNLPHDDQVNCNISTRSQEEVAVWSMMVPKFSLHSNSKNNKFDPKIKANLIQDLVATSRPTQIKDIWN